MDSSFKLPYSSCFFVLLIFVSVVDLSYELPAASDDVDLPEKTFEESKGEDLKNPSLVPEAEESEGVKSEIPQKSEVDGSNNAKEDQSSKSKMEDGENEEQQPDGLEKNKSAQMDAGVIENKENVPPSVLPSDPASPSDSKLPSDSKSLSDTKSPSDAESPSDPKSPSDAETPSDPKSPSDAESPSDSKSPSDPKLPSDAESPSDSKSQFDPKSPSDAESPADFKSQFDPKSPSDAESPSDFKSSSDSKSPSDAESPSDPKSPSDSKSLSDYKSPPDSKSPSDTETIQQSVEEYSDYEVDFDKDQGYLYYDAGEDLQNKAADSKTDTGPVKVDSYGDEPDAAEEQEFYVEDGSKEDLNDYYENLAENSKEEDESIIIPAILASSVDPTIGNSGVAITEHPLKLGSTQQRLIKEMKDVPTPNRILIYCLVAVAIVVFIYVPTLSSLNRQKVFVFSKNDSRSKIFQNGSNKYRQLSTIEEDLSWIEEFSETTTTTPAKEQED